MRVRDILIEHKQGFYRPGKFENGNVLFARISDLTDDAFLDDTCAPQISVEPNVVESFGLRENDFLFARTGGAGRFGVVTKSINGIFASYLIRFRFKDSYDARFLRYFFLSETFQTELTAKIHGGVNQNVHAEDIKDCWVPNMPLPQQKRIVEILDEAFACIDMAKANTEKNIQNARELFDSYLNNIFSNPGPDWATRRIGEIGVVQTGTTPKTAEPENYGDFIPFIKPSDVNYTGTGDIRYDNEALSKLGLAKGRLIKANSVLMVCIGATIGKVGFAERQVSCNQQINSVTAGGAVEPRLVYYGMTSNAFQYLVQREGSGAQATLPIINKSKWENLPLAFPISKEVQRSIVSKLDAISEELKELENRYCSRLGKLDDARKSILQKAVSGEIRKTGVLKSA